MLDDFQRRLDSSISLENPFTIDSSANGVMSGATYAPAALNHLLKYMINDFGGGN